MPPILLHCFHIDRGDHEDSIAHLGIELDKTIPIMNSDSVDSVNSVRFVRNDGDFENLENECECECGGENDVFVNVSDTKLIPCEELDKYIIDTDIEEHKRCFSWQKFHDAFVASDSIDCAPKNTDSGSICVLYGHSIPSTQTLLTDIIGVLPKNVNIAVIADNQTKGRGRMANQWTSQNGSMFMSLCLKLDQIHGEWLGCAQYVAGIAVMESLKCFTPPFPSPLSERVRVRVKLKWPNDLIVENVDGENGASSWRKLGGILCESRLLDNEWRVIIGIGLNVNNSGPDPALSVGLCDLLGLEGSDAPLSLSVSHIAGSIAREMSRLWSIFSVSGFSSLSDMYYKHWMHSGQVVGIECDDDEEDRVATDTAVMRGTIQGVSTQNGALIAIDERGIEHEVDSLGHGFDLRDSHVRVRRM